VLIILVTYGHVLSSMSSGASAVLLQWIFMFHVPAFVFLSGYATRYVSRWSPLDLAGRLLLPYLVLQIAHRGLIALLTDADFSLRLFQPAWTLWYLVALFAWRLIAPALKAIPFSVAVVSATVISVGAGMVPALNTEFSAGRILGFLPFFAAGLLWRDEWWRWLLAKWTWVAGCAALLGAGVWAYENRGSVNRRAWWFSQPYEALGETNADGAKQRLVILVVAAVLTLAVLTVTMRLGGTLAVIGMATLQIYVLHPLLLYPWHLNGAPEWMGTRWGLVVTLAGVCAFAWLVSRPVVVRAMRPLLDYHWWVRRRA